MVDEENDAGIPIYKATVRCAADKAHKYFIWLPSTPFFLPETEMISAIVSEDTRYQQPRLTYNLCKETKESLIRAD